MSDERTMEVQNTDRAFPVMGMEDGVMQGFVEELGLEECH